MLSLTRAIRASVTVQQVVGVVRAKLSGNKAVENTLIVDVRSTGEVAQTGIIPTAINIPLKLLPAALSDEVDDDEFLDVFGVPKPQKGVTQLIFYCAHGVRSATATEVAEDAGYTNAKNFGGSFTDWQNHSNAFRDGACDKVGTAASTAHPGDKQSQKEICISRRAGILVMGHGPSNEQMEQRQALNKFHMEALVKSKRNGKNKDVSIVDVRESFEVKKYGAIPFSVHIPSSEVRNAFLMSPAAFEARYKARMPDKYDKIVFYDQRHGRAVAAAELVESLGYTSATVFVDGYAGWLKSIDNAGREDL